MVFVAVIVVGGGVILLYACRLFVLALAARLGFVALLFCVGVLLSAVIAPIWGVFWVPK